MKLSKNPIRNMDDIQLSSQLNHSNDISKLINPRSSYQQQHSNYFKKLQEQMLQKSDRYATLIGKKSLNMNNNSSSTGSNTKIEQLKVKSQKKTQNKKLQSSLKSHLNQQNMITKQKNSSFTKIQVNNRKLIVKQEYNKAEMNSKLKIKQNQEQEGSSKNTNKKDFLKLKDHFSYHKNTRFASNNSPSFASNNLSLTNLHSPLDLLQPKKCVSRQQTQRSLYQENLQPKYSSKNLQKQERTICFADKSHKAMNHQSNQIVSKQSQTVNKQGIYQQIESFQNKIQKVKRLLKNYHCLQTQFNQTRKNINFSQAIKANSDDTLCINPSSIKSSVNDIRQTFQNNLFINEQNKSKIYLNQGKELPQQKYYNITHKNLKMPSFSIKQSSSIQLQRKLAYNLTFENNQPSIIVQDNSSVQNSQKQSYKENQTLKERKFLSQPSLNQKFKNSTQNQIKTLKEIKKIQKSSQKQKNLQKLLVQSVSTKISSVQNSKNHLNSHHYSNNESSNSSLLSNTQIESLKKKSMQSTYSKKQLSQITKDQNQNNENFKSFQLSQKLKRLSLKNRNDLLLIDKAKISINDFLVLSEIGQGKTGLVYMVKHSRSNFICALKVISKVILSEAVIVQIQREIKTQFFLEHPNIVQLYGVFSDKQNVYLLMQLCFGGNLYTHLRKQRYLPEHQIKSIVKQVCFALEYMHDNQIIHRDLKPQNILFHENIIKICDLGWAVYSPLPRDTLCGTPIYTSPQIVQKKKYGNKIDVWNVGILTYQLLCGRVPFEIRSQDDLYKVILQQVHFPKSIPISEYCKDFINVCLYKKPEKRYSISQLLQHPFLQ